MSEIHKTNISVRFRDLDSLNHVNNAVYFTYLECARTAYFDDLFGNEIDWISRGLILASTKLDFKKPVLLKDKIYVTTRCSHIGSKSFSLDYDIINQNNEIVARGNSVLVCYNYEKGESIEIPADWKERIINFESESIDNS